MNDVICMARHTPEGWLGPWPLMCTLDAGHDGPHVAGGLDDEVLAVWAES